MKRSTFYKEDSVRGESVRHLRYVISDPDPDEYVMVVNMSTYHGLPSEDKTCLLYPGDHEEVKRESYIVYTRAEAMDRYKIMGMAAKGLIVYKNRISPAVLQKLQDGARKSPFLKEDFKRFFAHF